ncbi:hypothetical protein [Parafrankia sp. BMG5.11]|uniref:hypothetical protein n=1 Tax=Parafrankia sp. BMG5.11 TaxID=222540 RepID=UPI001404BACE|nr:hypothetical protein [Parafrankia sp. BMG5.11]
MDAAYFASSVPIRETAEFRHFRSRSDVCAINVALIIGKFYQQLVSAKWRLAAAVPHR